MQNLPITYSVLIVDDDKDDQMFICSAFEELGINIALKTFDNGKLLLDYFQDQKPERGQSFPGFVLLDLNMPVMDGMQTLQQIRKNHYFDQLPIVILSTSNRPRDVESALQLQANGYICKPLKCSDYRLIADKLIRFWNGAEEEESSDMIKFLRKNVAAASK